MRLIIDGDGTPNREQLTLLARKYHIPVLIYCDMSHEITSDYARIILCDTGYQSVDEKIMNHLEKGDLLVTQDYGLAAIALSLNAIVFHPNGLEYKKEEIDFLLHSRYENSKLRRQKKRIIGPKKRTKLEEQRLLYNIEKKMTNS